MRTWLLTSLATLLLAGGVTAAQARPAAAQSDSFRDCPTCPEMKRIPPGSFIMGASLEEEAEQGMPAPLRGHAMPQHKVTFAKSFAMGKYPVTVAQFREFVNDTGYQAGDSCFTQYTNDGHKIYEARPGYSWRDPGFPQTDNNPAVCVSYEDGVAYAEWLSKKTGHKYSLPNEAQYEYSLRAGTTTPFFWSAKRDASACQYSNQPDLDQGRAMGDVPMGPEYRFQCSDGYAYTSPVGHYKPNPWGLYDMQGNIWEYTADCWNPNYEGAPTDGSTWRTGDCDASASRGGSFGNAAFSAYAGIRTSRDNDFRGHSWGFRVVRND